MTREQILKAIENSKHPKNGSLGLAIAKAAEVDERACPVCEGTDTSFGTIMDYTEDLIEAPVQTIYCFECGAEEVRT